MKWQSESESEGESEGVPRSAATTRPGAERTGPSEGGRLRRSEGGSEGESESESESPGESQGESDSRRAANRIE
ncbi:hypothetical protein [Coraliomargarita akajimensis]|uniref:hypothetical protein n=1 Tax=Coraliomargarita akajimensis TaxID=395922 RepID=UPI00059F6D6E|nr:hypothetical protein [Coraliomargarita akajimensis]